MCDPSDFSIGAILGQRVNKISHVIYHGSGTLIDAQKNYSTTEKELLVVVFALDKFRSHLLCSKVIVFANHAALRYLLANNDTKPKLISGFCCYKNLTLRIKTRVLKIWLQTICLGSLLSILIT